MANYYIIITEYDYFTGYTTKVLYAETAQDIMIKYRWYAQFKMDYGDHYFKVSKPVPHPNKYVIPIPPHVHHNKPHQTDWFDNLPW